MATRFTEIRKTLLPVLPPATAWLAAVTFAWLLALSPMADATGEAAAVRAVDELKTAWAEIFYRQPRDQQTPKLKALLPRVRELARRYPQAAEPLIMETLILCALAAADGGFGALGKLRDARELLEKSLKLDPLAMEGSAFVILGNLYYRLPGWPISFGDNELARRHLETALRFFPDALDTNYFYGDFLLEQGDFRNALIHLEKAEKAPVRDDARLSDLQLKQELKQALKDARERNLDRSSFFSRFLAIFRKSPS